MFLPQVRFTQPTLAPHGSCDVCEWSSPFPYSVVVCGDGILHDKEGGIIDNVRRWTLVNILTWQRD